MTLAQQPGWDAERGHARWEGFTEAERQQKLADADALLLAAQGLKLNPDGSAVARPTWRNLEHETRKPMTTIQPCRFCGRPIQARSDNEDAFVHIETEDSTCRLDLNLQAEPAAPGAFLPAPSVTGNALVLELLQSQQHLFGELERVARLWETAVEAGLVLRKGLEQIQQVLAQTSSDLPKLATAPDAQPPVTGAVDIEVIEHRSQSGELIGRVLPFGGAPISGTIPPKQRMERHMSASDGNIGDWQGGFQDMAQPSRAPAWALESSQAYGKWIQSEIDKALGKDTKDAG